MTTLSLAIESSCSSGGQELLAHELTHVVQQGGSSLQPELQDDSTANQSSGLQRKGEEGEEKGGDPAVLASST